MGFTDHDLNLNALSQAGGDPGAAIAILLDNTKSNHVHKYAAQIKQLKDMGFRDESSILAALEISGGDVQKATTNLLKL